MAEEPKESQDSLIAAMTLQISEQAKKLDELEGCLRSANQKLSSARREIAVKSHFNECLQVDLEHAITQLKRIQKTTSTQDEKVNINNTPNPRWIERPVPGLEATA